MIEYSQKQIDSFYDRGESLKLEDMRFVGCEFSKAMTSLLPKHRPYG